MEGYVAVLSLFPYFALNNFHNRFVVVITASHNNQWEPLLLSYVQWEPKRVNKIEEEKNCPTGT